MIADTKGQAFGAGRLFPPGYNIPLRPHARRVPRVMTAVVKVEIVVVAGHRHEISGAHLLVALQKSGRIPGLRLPAIDDLHESGVGRMAVIGEVMLVGAAARKIHQPAVPVARLRLALRSPMSPYAELGITEPLRGFPALDQRRPVRLEGCRRGRSRHHGAKAEASGKQVAPFKTEQVISSLESLLSDLLSFVSHDINREEGASIRKMHGAIQLSGRAAMSRRRRTARRESRSAFRNLRPNLKGPK